MWALSELKLQPLGNTCQTLLESSTDLRECGHLVQQGANELLVQLTDNFNEARQKVLQLVYRNGHESQT